MRPIMAYGSLQMAAVRVSRGAFEEDLASRLRPIV